MTRQSHPSDKPTDSRLTESLRVRLAPGDLNALQQIQRTERLPSIPAAIRWAVRRSAQASGVASASAARAVCGGCGHHGAEGHFPRCPVVAALTDDRVPCPRCDALVPPAWIETDHKVGGRVCRVPRTVQADALAVMA